MSDEVTGKPTVETDFTTETQDKAGFTQEDIDRIVKERLSRERSKILKQYEGIDLDRYRELTEKEEQLKLEQEKARGNFEKVLQDTVTKKDTAIQQLQKELQAIKVDGSLLNAASSRKAINPQQVVRLLKDNIKLSASGEVEILDDQGNVRYTDQGSHMTVDELVNEFLTTNPHFVTAGPPGSGSQSHVSQGKSGLVDPAKLNMNDPKDRALYREHMKSKGIKI
jgi:hypothetical protein